MLSFFWHVDQAHDTLAGLTEHLGEGQRPLTHILRELQDKYDTGSARGLELSETGMVALPRLGLSTAQG